MKLKAHHYGILTFVFFSIAVSIITYFFDFDVSGTYAILKKLSVSALVLSLLCVAFLAVFKFNYTYSGKTEGLPLFLDTIQPAVIPVLIISVLYAIIFYAIKRTYGL